MAVLTPGGGPAAFELHMPPAIDMNREQFFQFCQLNRDVRIERNAQGSITVMTPAGGETGARGQFLSAALYRWAEADGTGVSFDSSTGFDLPNGAVRAPDAAWVPRNRLARLSPEDKERFLPLCPDFVIELLSPSDSRAAARRKMEEYRANGARLGWLIDPARRQVTIYRADGSVEQHSEPDFVTGETVLPGFTLDLVAIWKPPF